MTAAQPLAGRAVFISASIPDPQRWAGEFDAGEITDAVVAACRAILTAGGTVVTAAHPTIAPLVLYVAAEFPRDAAGSVPVITYQSALFESVMPEATVRFRRSGIGDFRMTPAVPGERPDPEHSHSSLRTMREAMFADTEPVAAVFVGGMDGIREEYELLRGAQQRPLFYPIARPGGEAARLVAEIDSPLRETLDASDVYPALFRLVIADIEAHLGLDDRGRLL